MEASILRMIESIGIAGATVYFLLFYFSKKIDRLTDAINSLVDEMRKTNLENEKRFTRIESQLDSLKQWRDER